MACHLLLDVPMASPTIDVRLLFTSLLIVSVAWTTAAAEPVTVELLASADAGLDSAIPGTNLGSEPVLRASWSATSGERTERALLRFPVEEIPAGALVESAFLELAHLDGSDGPVARVADAWAEDVVFWDRQPRYTTPLAQPLAGEPGRWDVTALVQGWQGALFPDHGLALVETIGTEASAGYQSREGGSPPRLIVTYTIDDAEPEPQMPPGLGAPSFELDPGLPPIVPALAPIVVAGESVPRPLAVLQAERDTPLTFVADEVIFTPADPAQLDAFLETYAGFVLREPGLPAPPPELEDQARELDPATDYLIRVDPGRMGLETLEADAAELGMRGEMRISSEPGLRLLAGVLRERRSGLDVGLNAVGRFAQRFPPLGLEEEPVAPLFEDPINQSVTYSEMSDVSTQRTGVNRAWQYVAFATRQPAVSVAIIDGGFCLESNGTRCTDASVRTHVDLPAGIPQYDFNDDDYIAAGDNTTGCGDTSCPDHGSGVTSIATAVQDNRYGIAGTGSPVARPILLKVDVGLFQGARSIRTATAWGARVTNMSWTITCGWYCTLFSGISGYGKMVTALTEANNAGVVTVAAAGNNDEDLSDEFYVPCQLKWTSLCVGALANDSRNRASFSNYGTKSASPFGTGGVRIWAPGENVRVGPDRRTTSNSLTSGTSLAAPFVAGAAALALAVDPTLDDDKLVTLVFSTRRAPLNTQVAPGSIDVMRMVQTAGVPLDDRFGSHSDVGSAVNLPAAGLTDLTVLPSEDDYFSYRATDYQSAAVRAEYVEPLGDLVMTAATPALMASQAKTTGARSTLYTLTSQPLCANEPFDLRLRGTTPAVGNGYRLTVQTTATTSLKADANEPNDTTDTATAITAPRESPQDLTSVDRIDCRNGLTLHTASDVDFYTFTVAPGDLDSDFTGVSVRIQSDFPVIAKLYRNGVEVLSKAEQSPNLEIANAQPGGYGLEIRGIQLNAYTLRTRVYDPDGRERAYDLEAWLKGALLPDPNDLLPPCGGGCVPMPDWLRELPFDPDVLFALEANGVAPLVDDLPGAPLPLDGNPHWFAIGALEPGTTRIGLGWVGEFTRGPGGGVHALLLDADGNELFRLEGLQGATDWDVELEPGRTYLLVVNGTSGEALLVVDLPGEPADQDEDGVPDPADNCLVLPNPEQLDSDLDGYGNLCDADYNNDGAVGISDFNHLRSQFDLDSGDPGFDPAVDANGDGAIGIPDFNALRGAFGEPPGPSGLDCAGSPPCPSEF